MKLKDFAPPIIVNLVRRSKQSKKLYDSYENALAICKDGYEENDLTAVVYEKTRLYRDSLIAQHPFVSEITSFRTLIGLSLASRGKELNVIDFGGACGAHYFVAKMVFGEKLNLRWHVVETPKMVSRAIELQDGQLEFFDDVQKAKRGFDRIDLVFSSCALQYASRPYDFMEQLVECRADNILISRVGLSPLPKELVILQKSHLSANGPGSMPQGMRDRIVRYPVTLVRKDKFEEILSKNYSIKILFNDDKAMYWASNHSIDLYGYFGVLKSRNIK